MIQVPRPNPAENAMVEVKTFGDGSDLQLVHGYGDGGFRVAGTRHKGSLLLLPREAAPWTPPADLDTLAFVDLEPLLGDVPPPLFVLGTGDAPMHPFTDLAAQFRAQNIAFELLSTAAACRTWNVLMSEGRNAAAALVAI